MKVIYRFYVINKALLYRKLSMREKKWIITFRKKSYFKTVVILNFFCKLDLSMNKLSKIVILI